MTNEQYPTNELIASALRLPVSDRVALVNAMLDSMENDSEQLSQSDIDESWSDEIALRIREIESGEVSPCFIFGGVETAWWQTECLNLNIILPLGMKLFELFVGTMELTVK